MKSKSLPWWPTWGPICRSPKQLYTGLQTAPSQAHTGLHKGCSQDTNSDCGIHIETMIVILKFTTVILKFTVILNCQKKYKCDIGHDPKRIMFGNIYTDMGIMSGMICNISLSWFHDFTILNTGHTYNTSTQIRVLFLSPTKLSLRRWWWLFLIL